MPPRAADAVGLDIAEPQIALYYEQDPNFQWHSRILLERLNEADRWVAVTPDGDVQVLDLSAARAVPLATAAPAPERIRGNRYHFGPVDEDTLLSWHREARALAAVAGGAAAAAVVAVEVR